MKIKPNYLYRVLGDLQKGGQGQEEGPRFRAAASVAPGGRTSSATGRQESSSTSNKGSDKGGLRKHLSTCDRIAESSRHLRPEPHPLSLLLKLCRLAQLLRQPLGPSLYFCRDLDPGLSCRHRVALFLEFRSTVASIRSREKSSTSRPCTISTRRRPAGEAGDDALADTIGTVGGDRRRDPVVVGRAEHPVAHVVDRRVGRRRSAEAPRASMIAAPRFTTGMKSSRPLLVVDRRPRRCLPFTWALNRSGYWVAE